MVSTCEQNRVESVDQLSQTQERLERDMSSLKGEIVAMNKKLDQRFKQLMKLHEDSGRSPLLADGNNKVLAKKSPGSSRMGGNGGFDGVNSDFIRDFRFRKLEIPFFYGTNPDGWLMKAERYLNLY